MIAIQIIFWISLFALFHSYILYPLLLRFLASKIQAPVDVFPRNGPQPSIKVLMSVYNEQEVIADKISSILNSDYPQENISIFIGSDASTDDTDRIISEKQIEYPSLHYIRFTKRIGKANVIIELAKHASDKRPVPGSANMPEVFLLTDANVMLGPDTIYELTKHFKRSAVGVVDSVMQGVGLKEQGISHQEKGYVARESVIKYHEGLIWGTMIGPSGGCYALRADLYEPVPSNYLVDDFYITMKVLEQGYEAINEPNAICYEDVSSHIFEEFRRKIRISTGNFQNLSTFASSLFPPYKPLAFSFFSHKLLRWLGPFFMIILYLCSLNLMGLNQFYYYLFILEHLIFVGILLDLVLQFVNVQLKSARFITHFFMMNLALLIGFFKYITGVKSNVWEPTKRNQ